MEYSVYSTFENGKTDVTLEHGIDPVIQVVVETTLSGNDDVESLVEAIDDFIYWNSDDNITNIIIQKDDDGLGIIVDLYMNDSESDPITDTFWFDSYKD